MLTSTSDLTPKDAKPVLRTLALGSREREDECIARLHTLGHDESGLQAFLDMARAIARRLFVERRP